MAQHDRVVAFVERAVTAVHAAETDALIFFAVIVGPDGIWIGVLWPVADSLMWMPPTWMTRIRTTPS